MKNSSDEMPPFAIYINAGATFSEEVPELERLHMARRTSPERYSNALNLDANSRVQRTVRQYDPHGPITYYDRDVPYFRYTETNREVMEGTDAWLVKHHKREIRRAQLADPVFMAEEARQQEAAARAKREASEARKVEQRLARLERELREAQEETRIVRGRVAQVGTFVRPASPPPPPRQAPESDNMNYFDQFGTYAADYEYDEARARSMDKRYTQRDY